MISEVEVIRRLPEVLLIDSDDIREETIHAIQNMPDYFWDVPATSSGKYHNPFAREKHGLWIHVKMAYAMYERLVDSYVHQGFITEEEADAGRSAILLHDMFKQGYADERLAKPPDDRHTIPEHDVLAAEWLEANTTLPEMTINAVESHNGPWYEGRPPKAFGTDAQFHLCQLVHMADMSASSKNNTPGMYKPAREIAEKYPNIPRAEL